MMSAIITISMNVSSFGDILNDSLNRNIVPHSARKIVAVASMAYSYDVIAIPVDFLMLHSLFNSRAFAGTYSFEGVI